MTTPKLPLFRSQRQLSYRHRPSQQKHIIVLVLVVPAKRCNESCPARKKTRNRKRRRTKNGIEISGTMTMTILGMMLRIHSPRPCFVIRMMILLRAGVESYRARKETRKNRRRRRTNGRMRLVFSTTIIGMMNFVILRVTMRIGPRVGSRSSRRPNRHRGIP